jgi:probable rRNA maturation factor
VLSFPPAGVGTAKHGGDLAISIETAQRQADEHEHSLSEELRVLLLHGLLHLAGMDHETDDGEMAGREAKLRRKFKLSPGLIARVHERSSGRIHGVAR